MKGYKPKYLRQKNYVNILNQFKVGRPISAAEVRRQVDLSLTTINSIIAQLLEMDLLRSVGKGSSSKEGGKRPVLYELNSDCALCFSILINDKLCFLRLVDFALNTVYAEKFSFDGRAEYPEVIEATAQKIESVMSRYSLEPSRIYGVACHFQGVVDGENGVIVRSMSRMIPNNARVREDLSARLGLEVPIFIENSSHFAGNYELLDPRNNNVSPLLVINISFSPDDLAADEAGTGVGGCLIENGQMQLGSGGFLSEMGHMIVDFDSDILCKCGCRGCLESFVQPEYISKEARRLRGGYPDSQLGRDCQQGLITFLALLGYAKAGDSLAERVVETIVQAFAILVHNLLLSYRPQRIVIQSVEEDGLIQLFAARLRERVSQQLFLELIDHFDIACSLESFETQSNLGAASFCRDRYMSSVMSGLGL